MKLGERLRRYRKRSGLKQWELAEACGWTEPDDPKAGQSRISQYEAGTRTPSLDDIERLATVLGVRPAELAYGETRLQQAELDLLQAWNLATAMQKRAIESWSDMVLSTAPENKPSKTRLK